MNGHVFVSDLRLSARVGVNPGEHGREQPIVVDVWVGLDSMLEAAARTEQLGDTVDYVAVARVVREVVTRRHYPLVEGLADTIARELLLLPGASWARVRLHKLGCLRHASAAGVELERRADDHPVQVQPLALSQVPAREPLVVLGGGVAGLIAAQWCDRLGHPALLIDERERLGGQLHMVYTPMPDLPALPPMTGKALSQRLWRQFVDHQGRWLRMRVATVEPAAETIRLTLSPVDRETACAAPAASRQEPLALEAHAVIVASGVRRRALGLAEETSLFGRGVLPTAARGRARLRDRHVVVVGGGDSACENALLLADDGARVTLVHRGPALSARQQFVRAASADGRITMRSLTRVTGLRGKHFLEAVELASVDGGGTEVLAADEILIRIGWVPNTECLPPAWLADSGYAVCDETGALLADGQGRAQGRCFAAGDVLGRAAPSVASSVGTACLAAAGAVNYLESRAPRGADS